MLDTFVSVFVCLSWRRCKVLQGHLLQEVEGGEGGWTAQRRPGIISISLSGVNQLVSCLDPSAYVQSVTSAHWPNSRPLSRSVRSPGCTALAVTVQTLGPVLKIAVSVPDEPLTKKGLWMFEHKDIMTKL